MNPARVVNGAVVEYPYLLRPAAKQAHPEVSPLPGTWEQCTPEQLEALECVDVLATIEPELQPGETLSEGTPEFAGGEWRQTWVVEAIPIEQMQAQVGAAVQSMIDAVCTSGVPYFRDIFSARGYVNDPNPAYHARAVALRDWSSSVWTTLDEIQADVMAGNRSLPTLPELLAELPQPPA